MLKTGQTHPSIGIPIWLPNLAILAGLVLFNVAIAADTLIGLVQRIWLAVTLAWLLALGVSLYRVGAETRATAI
jgi:hypothetical protein